jgi:hypothetical protein
VIALTAFMKDTARIKHRTSCASSAWSWTSAGSWMKMSVHASIAWTTICGERDFSNGSLT